MYPDGVVGQLAQMRQAEIRQVAAEQRLAAQVHRAMRTGVTTSPVGVVRHLLATLRTALQSRGVAQPPISTPSHTSPMTWETRN